MYYSLFLKNISDSNKKIMRFLYIILTAILISSSSTAQTDTATAGDTVATYRKTPYIPSFRIQTPDSSWFSRTNLQAGRPTLILYFSPDCGHCQTETEELLSKIKQFNNLQIVMITSRPFEDMANFAEHYKINRFHTIKIGTDPIRYVTTFYDVKFTPFSALYDKKGMLVKVYEKGIDMEELSGLVK
jgi:cytochrome oxidase Cu insertion factor (SCO1/SenC/PrrC family)